MSRIFTYSKLGKRAYRDNSVDEDEFRVLEHLVANKSASEDQLEIIGGERWRLRDMKKKGLVLELTT